MTANDNPRGRTIADASQPPDEHLNGADILDAVQAFLQRFIVYPNPHVLLAHTLWVAHTHRMDTWRATPRLAFMSAEPGSGKTRAMEITELLVPQPVLLANVSSAYIFRRIDSPTGRPTLLLDEIDVVLAKQLKSSEEIRSLLNAGYLPSGTVGRCEQVNKQMVAREYPAYCAVCLGGIGDLPNTIQSRAIVIEMRRRSRSTEPVSVYRASESAAAGHALRDQLHAWLKDEPLPDPTLPPGIQDRAADVWEALISVADAAGGEWPTRARVTAVTLVTHAETTKPSQRVQLLIDLRRVFGTALALPTATILKELCAMEESIWGDLDARPLDARRLARMLKAVDVTPTTIRFAQGLAKGYARKSLMDAWERYVGEGGMEGEEE